MQSAGTVAAVLGTTAGISLVSACNYAAIDEAAAMTTTPEKISQYHLALLNDDTEVLQHRLMFHPYQTWLSFSYAPLVTEEEIEPTELVEIISDIKKVRPSRTPWASAWNRESVVLGMNEILLAHGIASENVRVRMIAHAIVASGWKQSVWNFNAWGVRQGSWDKSWYIMPTFEEDDNGNFIYVADATWRAFTNWEEAISDFQQRISPNSERPSYREAYRYLVSDTVSYRVAKAYWNALGDGNYYTASNFTGDKFAQLCGGVRSVLRKGQSTALISTTVFTPTNSN